MRRRRLSQASPPASARAPLARLAAGAPIEADASRIAPAELGTFEWRGKPMWVVRRTEGMLKRLESLRAELIDPDSEVTSQQPVYARNPARSRQPELFVAVGLCTHLGCVPGYHPEPGSLQPGWPGGLLLPLPRLEV